MFNNFSLNNLEIEKILLEFDREIKKASKISGKVDEDCVQTIRIALYRKLSKNKNWNFFKNFSKFVTFFERPCHLPSRRINFHF